MQKKIYRTIIIIVTVAIFLLGLISVIVGFNIYTNSVKENIQSVAKISTSGNTTDINEIYKNVEKSLDMSVRVTYIKSDGTVNFDSEADVNTLENHSSRTEFIDAVKNGSGEATRESNSIGKSTYYYALKYNDGVIRFAVERSNIYSVAAILIPVILISAAVIIILATIISVKLSDGLIAPVNTLVNNIDLLDGEEIVLDEKSSYDELKPVVDKINRLSKRLDRYIRKLKREKERFTLLSENMVEGMILLDEEKNILSVNKSAVNILDSKFYKKDEAQNVLELTRNHNFLDIMDKCDKQKSFNGNININERSYRVFANKVLDIKNTGYIIILVDETDKIMSEQFRRDFSANVSHELKTPLTTIKGFGEMIEKGIISDPDDIKKYGGTIFRESERLLQLINDIIRLSEIEDSSVKHTEQVDLLKVVNDIIDILEYKADSNDIMINVTGESAAFEVNPTHINEVVLNLVDNAVKYNTTHGNVWVDVKDNGDRVSLCVSDDGIGISQEDRDRIFERFYRVDKSHSKKIGGTGLGLSIVKHIIKYYNGTLNIESELGKGTKITVTFPKTN